MLAGSAEVLKKLHARAEERGRLCILLHFGVSANSRTLKLEQVGYNVADFRVPDERGYVAKDEIIREGEPDKIYTNVPLDDLQKMLQPICSHISISTDPGRYICNYVYFRSLVWIIHRKAMGFPEPLALFVHVPKFSCMSFEDQVAVASKIVDIVAEM